MERARAGDHEAFTRLVDERLGSTYRTVMAILANETDARDVTQAIFISTWIRLPQLRDASLFQAWFGRIVVNTSRSALRTRRRKVVREIPVSTLFQEGADLVGADAAHEDRSAALDRLERAFDRLSADERTILWLHHHEELPLGEIGSRLSVPAKTVKSRLFTARRALERALQEEDR